MKFLLVGINAKYIHSNLAIHYLKGYCKNYQEHIAIKEYTINNQTEAILGDIFKQRPEAIGFSCYIWNINMIYELAVELKKVLPETKIWLGGPEVSYDGAQILTEHGYIDGVMSGEGEETFQQLMEYYVDKTILLSDIKGITYRSNEISSSNIYENAPRTPINLSTVPFPYEDMEEFSNKIIYYETSRGCPYSCSYCLSSVDKTVRFREIELVKKELQFFLDHKVPQVKFIDRTFNCKREHTKTIWEYLAKHDNGVTNFHFEISADIINKEEIELLKTLRPGLVQLEIGVQSTNQETLKAIHRTMSFNDLAGIVTKINEGRNVHQHLDLIAGLPYEDYDSFKNSFNQVYALEPEQLQLGFLKVLKGSYMHHQSKDYGIIYHEKAPYEVLYTRWVSYEQMLQLKAIEEMVEVYYNSGQFSWTIRYLEHFFENPFTMFESLAKYYEENNLFDLSHSRIKRFELLLDFYVEVVGKKIEIDDDVFKELLLYDCYLRENRKSKPSFAPQEERLSIAKLREFLKALTSEGKKQVHIEAFTVDVIETARTGQAVMRDNICMFDYEEKLVINNQAKVSEVDKDLLWRT